MRHLIAALILIPGLAIAGEWQTPYRVSINDEALAQGRFIVTNDTVKEAITDELVAREVAEHVRATLTSTASPVLYQSQQPVSLALQALQVNETTLQWQAEAYIISGQKTVSVIPVSGRYEVLREIPVLKRHVRAGDTILPDDLTTTLAPERQLRRDVLVDSTSILGKTPRRGISAQRPIRASEIVTPRMIEKGKMVQMRYTTAYMSIQSQGEAMEDGTLGEAIRIKNLDTERMVNARVVGENIVEVNLAAPVETTASYR